MKRFRRVAATIGLITVMISGSISQSFALNTGVYQKINKEMISSGVTHEHILRFYKDGWLNANVIYIDLDEENVKLDLLQSSKGLATKETLSTMVKAQDNVVAAINGDYFYLTTPDSPIGAMIRDGEVISSPIIVHDYATFSIDNNNMASADYWKYDIYAVTDKEKIVPITSINKYTHEYQSTMMIDKNWGPQTPGYNPNHYDMVEVIIENDEVVEVRKQQPPTAIPDNGYVLLASQANAGVLEENFQIGDRVKVYTNIHGRSLENIKLAMGGGTVLVKNGQVASFTQVVTGNHPKTAIGISQDRKQLILVTIDGRHPSFKGVDGKNLANFMIELGSYEAIILDGGGSTTAMVRGLGDFNPKLVNYPSDGSERRIINGLALISQAGQAELGGIKAQVDYSKGFVGVGREITIKAFDKNNNPLTVDNSQIKYNFRNGQGNIVGNRLTPTKPGNIIVEVDYLGKKAEVSLEIFEELAMLKISPESLRLSYGQGVNLGLIGVDSRGYSTPIDAKDVIWEDEGGLGTFSGGQYRAGSKAGKTIIKATLGNQTAFAPVSIGESKLSLGPVESFDFKYTGYPTESVPGRVSLDTNSREGQYSIALEYDFTQTDATRAAYIEFENNNIILGKDALKLGFWAHADEVSPHWIRGYVKDAQGTRHTIDFKNGIDWVGWNYVEANIPQNLPGPLVLERIYLVETDANNKKAGKILFSGLDITRAMEIEELPVIKVGLQDKLNVDYEEKGRQIFIHSGVNLNSVEEELKNTVAKRIQELVNSQYSMAVFTSSIDETIAQGITKTDIVGANTYKTKEFENNLLIQLNNRGGGLRAADFSQWSLLMNQLNTTSKKNIFITLPRPIWGYNGFNDELEINLFKDTLTKAAEKGKNVFVLYGGEADVKIDLVDGVRYISTGTYNNQAPTSSKYVEFNILENKVTYQIKSLF